MEMLRLNNWEEFQKLDKTLWGIRQHSIDLKLIQPLNKPLDLILMPGVAFNKNGRRLGHGMGYYDRFLHKHIDDYSNHKLKKIALALTLQMVKEIPVEEHDVILDSIIHA